MNTKHNRLNVFLKSTKKVRQGKGLYFDVIKDTKFFISLYNIISISLNNFSHN